MSHFRFRPPSPLRRCSGEFQFRSYMNTVHHNIVALKSTAMVVLLGVSWQIEDDGKTLRWQSIVFWSREPRLRWKGIFVWNKKEREIFPVGLMNTRMTILGFHVSYALVVFWCPFIEVSCHERVVWSRLFPAITLIARFMGPTWGPPGSCRPQVDPMLVPWTLLCGVLGLFIRHWCAENRKSS